METPLFISPSVSKNPGVAESSFEHGRDDAFLKSWVAEVIEGFGSIFESQSSSNRIEQQIIGLFWYF